MNELDFLEVKRANYAKFGSVLRPEGGIISKTLTIGDLFGELLLSKVR